MRVRVRVVDDKGRELGASRDLGEIAAGLRQHHHAASAAVARVEPAAWRQARAKWETTPQTAWTFGVVPERIVVTEQAGVPVFAYPGLQVEAAPPGRKAPLATERPMQAVALRLFATAGEARAATHLGLIALLERELSHELGWLERDLRAVRQLGPLIALLSPPDELQAQAFSSIRRWICDPARILGRTSIEVEPGGGSCTQEEFQRALAGARADLLGLVPRFVTLLREILVSRQALLVTPKPPPWLADELATLIPPDFLRLTPHPQLAHFPRYLKAFKLRIDRWRQNPAKDAERAAQLAPYHAALVRLRRAGRAESVDAFRWLIEELRVSLFAQELGTAEPVSAVKLDRALAALGAPTLVREEPAAAPKPIVTAAKRDKGAPLKNLNALDRLFQR